MVKIINIEDIKYPMITEKVIKVDSSPDPNFLRNFGMDVKLTSLYLDIKYLNIKSREDIKKILINGVDLVNNNAGKSFFPNVFFMKDMLILDFESRLVEDNKLIEIHYVSLEEEREKKINDIVI